MTASQHSAEGRERLIQLLIALAMCAAIVQCVLPRPVIAAQPTLKIRVTDPDGLAITKARIILRPAIGGRAMEMVPAADGSAEIRPPARGRFVLMIEAEGFANDSRMVDWEEKPTAIDVSLKLGGLQQQVMVTSGSRVEELQQESPIKVEAVTRQDMLTTGYERLSDVLSEIPGVVTRSGSSGSVSSEQIRGISARQVAVLQDGLPIIGARGIKSGNINLNRQSTARLDRVEVVKGATSALFGSDAIGGVINMISREPSERFEGGLNFSGGTLGIFDGRGDIGTRYKNLTAFLDLEHHRQSAYGLVPGSQFTVGPDLRRNDLFFRTRYFFTPRIALGFSANAYHNREQGRNASETGPVSGLYNDSIQNYALVADLLPTSRTAVQLRAYSARYDENSRLDSLGAPAPPTLANLNQRYKRLDGTISHQLGSRNLLQGGYEWVQDNYKGANRLVGDNGGRQITSNDVWLQDKFQLTRFATLDLGGRISNHSLFGSWAVPKVGLVVRLNNHWTARGAFGKGFRAPDLGQLFYRFANPASFYQVIGNPNLEPETSRSFSTGVDFRARRFRGGISLFRNDVRNLIDSVSIGTPRTVEQLAELLNQFGIPFSFNPLLNRQTFIYQNFGRIYTQGFELNAEQMITPQLRVAGAYTYLDARDTSTKFGLPQRHKHQGYMRTEYASTRLGLLANIRGSFFSRWLLNPAAGTSAYGYGLWDFYVSKNVARGVQAYFSIDNFADSRDQKLNLAAPTFDRPDYGRQYRVGFRWRSGTAE
jgi:outer membrane receptor for ferrienterochelin and colicins